MRLFVALDIPGPIRSKLSGYMDRVRGYSPESKWARVEGLHVTLKFIGEVKDEKLEAIKAALADAKAPPFQVAFEGIGFFPNTRAPRVFWAGVNADDSLSRLANSVDDALVKIGYEPEDKAYHPHLTLARARERELRALTPLLESEDQPHFGTMTAREFFLYQSHTGRGGSRYDKLETFRLA
ncbi:MAG TPA: RNA 2',3'-cyclic phosphodiesterase [Candidatus Limnocylindrales bacterium]|nr:RNA 2',3'-cyclic phosphodiesterase [Candidatus Limnocylindrales bacterium]